MKKKIDSNLLTLDEDFVVGYQEKEKQIASEDILNWGSTVLEHIKFISGKNDLQEWIENNRVLRGKKFSYENADFEMMLGEKDKQPDKCPRPYLRQYINDTTRDKTIIKCRQSEFSENEINENFWLAMTVDYCNIRHIFPTGGMAAKMAKEKISPAAEDSPAIKRYLKRPFSMSSKEFQNGSFYTVDSSWTDHGGRGPSSDKITFDEYESQNPHIEEIYSESTSHSKLGRRTRISTPMFPNSGIDLRYNQGTSYEWWIKCPKCGHEQVMEFPENIMGFFEASSADLEDEEYIKKLNKAYLGCRYCKAYIDRTSNQYLKTSKWIARKPHLLVLKSSYRVTYMMLPWKTGKEILYKYHTFKFTHQFWNEIMGHAFVDPASRIHRSLFEIFDNSIKNSFAEIGNARNVSIGVDWGMVSWVVVRANGFHPEARKPRIIYVERIDKESLKKNGYPEAKQTDHVKRVLDIINKFKARIIVNDANGIGVDRNAHLVKVFPTKSWGCFYDTDEIQKQKRKERLIVSKWNEKSRTVTISRVNSFKQLVREYEEKIVMIPQLDPDIEEFIKHHANIIIQTMQDEKTEALYEIVGKIGADHYAHADVYSMTGFNKLVNIDRDGTAGVIDDRGSEKMMYDQILENPDLV